MVWWSLFRQPSSEPLSDPQESLPESLVLHALDDLKANDVRFIDVRGRTSLADSMIIASGTSTRHVKSLADGVVRNAKQSGYPPLGVEGEKQAEWILIDLGDVIVHLMLPRTRDFYNLEKLWLQPEQSQPATG